MSSIRCAIYARLSIERESSSDNVEIQIRECREYIEDQGWQIVHVFNDADISASKYSTKPRPGYNQLLEAVRADEVECIVITEMPRLYRRLEELLELMHLAERTALSRIQTTDGNYYDLSTGMGVHNAVSAVNTAMLEPAAFPTGCGARTALEPRTASLTVAFAPSGTRRAAGRLTSLKRRSSVSAPTSSLPVSRWLT